MLTIKGTGVVLALLIGCAGCRTPAGSSRAEALLATDTAFAQAAADDGVANAFREYAAPEAMSLPNGAKPIRGRDNISQSLLQEAGKLSWLPRQADISRSGDLGYTWGEYQYREINGAINYGKYVTVWKKQPDGSWKFVMDVGNSSPPPK